MVHGLIDKSTLKRIETIAEGSPDSSETLQRPRRQTVRPSRFSDYEIYSNARINEEGDVLHITLMAGTKPVEVDEALK